MYTKFCFSLCVFISSFLFSNEALAVNKNQQDRQAILAMAGTYKIHFHFQETVAFPQGYNLAEPYDAKALEVVIIDEETEDRIVLQHILQTKRGIIKHWRQDWHFENRELWEFQGDLSWTKREISEAEAAGTWTQRVFQVDDSPRYESFGRWTHKNGVSQWESAPTNRPLPRREYTKRDDYDILLAVNRQTLTATGWVHEQDNQKLVARDGQKYVLAREIGVNTYTRVDKSLCSEARQWWRDHRPFWVQVRNTWDDVFARKVTISLAKTVDEKPLYRHFFEMDKQWKEATLATDKDLQTQFRDVLARFGIDEKTTAAISPQD